MPGYNPYLELKDAPTGEAIKEDRDIGYNPYLGLTSYEEPKDPMAWKAIEKMTEAEKEEMEFAGKHPNLYGLVKASLETLSDFPIVGYLEYLSPERREEFKDLTKQEQVNELLWKSFNAALWAKIAPLKAGSVLLKYGVGQKGLFSDVGYLLKLPFQTAKKIGPKIVSGVLPKNFGVLRVEDALKKMAILSPKSDFKGFEYDKFLRKTLKGKGFHKKETELLTDALGRGTGTFSTMDTFQISELTRRGYKFSKAFQENVPLIPGKKLLRTLDKEFNLLHSKAIMEAEFRKKTFENVLREIYGTKQIKGFPKDFSLKVFQERSAKLYPSLGKHFNFGEASTVQMTNISLSLLEDITLTMKQIMPGRGLFMFPSLLPTRVVYGVGEKIFSTKTKIYDTIKLALGKSNRNYFNHILLWAKLLEQEGLYTSIKIKKTGEFIAKKAKFFTPDVSDRVYKVLTKMDDLTRQAAQVTDKTAAKALLNEARALPGKVFRKNDPGILLYNAYRTYSDHLYSDFFKGQFSRVLGKLRIAGALPDDIIRSLEGQSRLLEYEIDNLFSTVNKATSGWKMGSSKRLLGRAQRTILRGAERLSKEELAMRKEIASLFQYGSAKGFPAYLENYTARMRGNQLDLVASWKRTLATERTAAFRHPRRAGFGETKDLGTMIESRTMAQARELYLYDDIGKAVRYAKRLPPAYRDYIDAHISGVLGLPSTMDHKVAWFLTKTTGGVERYFGKTGVWDEWRVLELAHTVNTLTYLGALGFKPFSAMRNLFQTLINVPADLGGIKDLGLLVSGVKKALDPVVRKKLIQWGAITEFAPEVHLRPAALPFGKTKIMGKTLPSLKRVQDVGLWMFKGSDRWNRYVSGGAALGKWDQALGKVGGKIHFKNLGEFTKHLNLAGRRDYTRDKVVSLLLKGKNIEAQKTYVLDVIADTQYLYGVADAPIIIRKHGALAKTGFIFQSWWMNYGANLEKWIRTGEPLPAKVNRMFTAMISTAIAGTLMEQMWGKQTALRTVGMGPFPKEANEFLIPPAWMPIYHALAAISNIQTPKVSSRHARSILTSAGILLPGYLQGKALWRGAREEGIEGFARAIFRLKKPERRTGGFF